MKLLDEKKERRTFRKLDVTLIVKGILGQICTEMRHDHDIKIYTL